MTYSDDEIDKLIAEHEQKTNSENIEQKTNAENIEQQMLPAINQMTSINPDHVEKKQIRDDMSLSASNIINSISNEQKIETKNEITKEKPKLKIDKKSLYIAIGLILLFIFSNAFLILVAKEKFKDSTVQNITIVSSPDTNNFNNKFDNIIDNNVTISNYHNITIVNNIKICNLNNSITTC